MKKLFTLLTLLFLLTSACSLNSLISSGREPGAAAKRCGDGVCSGPETADTCPTDCATAPEISTQTPPAASANCTFKAAYAADASIPPGAKLPAGKSFTKSWRVRNTGDCPWKEGINLVFVSGDRLNGPASIAVEPVPPNGGAKISVDLTSPATPGDYKGVWQLQSPTGTNFGDPLPVRIIVPPGAASPTGTPPATASTATPQPPLSTPTAPTPTSTPAAPSPTATSPHPLPDLRLSTIGISPTPLISGDSFTVLAQVHLDGSQDLSGIKMQVTGRPAGSSCSDNTGVHLLQETTVNLSAGQSQAVTLSGQINAPDEHLVCVQIDPHNTIAEADESNNSQGQPVQVGKLATFSLDAANSGAIRHDGGASFTQFPNAQAGDGPNDRQVKGFLSWDTTLIPTGAEILSADIIWGTQCFEGGDIGDCTGNRDPFPSLGHLEMWSRHFDTLDIGDFKAVGMFPGTLLFTYTAQPTGSVVVTDAVADACANAQPFQVYAIFGHHSNNNGLGNGVVFPEGSGPNTLEVVYLP
jgi:hypothetical protein